jgi:hypothetical protein
VIPFAASAGHAGSLKMLTEYLGIGAKYGAHRFRKFLLGVDAHG